MKRIFALILAVFLVFAAGLVADGATENSTDVKLKTSDGAEYTEPEGEVTIRVYYLSNDVNSFNFFDDLINSGLMDESFPPVSAVDMKGANSEKYSEALPENSVHFLSVTDEDRKELLKSLKPDSYPVTILFDAAGNEALRYDGYVNPDDLKSAAKELEPNILPARLLKASSDSYNSLSLSWLASADADGYSVRRSDSLNGVYDEIADVHELSFHDDNLITARKYFYKIISYSSFDGVKVYSDKSPTVSAAAYLGIPRLCVENSGSDVKLNFSPVDGADGYIVLRSSEGKNYTEIARTAEISFNDTEFKSGDSYKVRAFAEDDREIIIGTASAPCTP